MHQSTGLGEAMTIRAALIFSVALLFAAPAFAQGVLVIGGSYAQDCFKAARADMSPSLSIPICDKALELDVLTNKDRAGTFVNRGILKTRAKRAEAAMKDYDQAVALKPDIAEIYVNRGATLILLARFREALDDLNKSLTLGLDEPKYAYYNRALAREYLDDVKGAYLDYKKALELDPEFADALREIKRFTVTTKPKSS
jgi:tetratricopeptide (TPR) repeat protein